VEIRTSPPGAGSVPDEEDEDMNAIHLDVVTPERLVLSEVVDELILPGSEGYLGVRPGHTPLLVGLGVGELSWLHNGRERRMAVAMGYAEVLPTRVVVLAETAERAEEIDVERARQAKSRAESVLSRSDDSNVNLERARVSLLRAATRLSVAAKSK
jgi:F-type H+-transporting ATPase subunit epsilon